MDPIVLVELRGSNRLSIVSLAYLVVGRELHMMYMIRERPLLPRG